MPFSILRTRRLSHLPDPEHREQSTALLNDEEKLAYGGDDGMATTRRRLSVINMAASIIIRLRLMAIFLLPSFVIARFFPDLAPSPGKPHKTAYLDGLRGVAAVSVVIFHYSNAMYTCMACAWGTRGNDGFIALPFVRLLYSGPFAVCLFFVISGFALSIKPVEYMLDKGGDGQKLFKSLNSAAFRRPIRLYVPAWASAFVVFLVLTTGVMDAWGFRERATAVKNGSGPDRTIHRRDEVPNASNTVTHGSPVHEISAFKNIENLFLIWFNGCVRMLCIFDTSQPAERMGHPFNSPLWSIVVEFRASIVLFLVQLAVANVRRNARIYLTVFLMVFSSYVGNWEMVLFIGGFLLAQIDPLIPAWEAQLLSKRLHFQLWNGFLVFSLVCGLYLASYPDYYAQDAPGYSTLAKLVPKSYAHESARFWQGIGGICIVFAVGRLPLVAGFFASKPIRWIGQISFALYLIHSMVLVTWGVSALYYIWGITGREDQFMETVGFFISIFFLLPVAMWLADIFWRLVDTPSVTLARWVETKLSRND